MSDAEVGRSRRPRLAIAAVLIAVCALSPRSSSAQREVPATSLDLVVIDVAVADKRGEPVPDLTVSDFQVKEDGKSMDIKLFTRVDSEADGPGGDGRSVALLLDDTGVNSLGSTAVQQLSKAVLSLAQRGDEVSVVRLHSSNDEAYGDMTEALARIDGFRGGTRPLVPGELQADALNRIALMSEQLAITEGRRKALVCIGTQFVCDVTEPGNDSRQDVYLAWRRAVAATARANVAVYAIVPGRLRLRGGGIVDATGGLTYGSSSDFRQPIVTLWNDSGAHYLLGYWPGAKNRELHSVRVSVARSGVRVRARKLRGE